MAYDFLKKLFGETKDGEEPKRMSWEELEEAIKAEKDISVYNLKDGGYVPIDKLNAKIAELAGVKQQLEDANKEIASYKDMDIEGIKKAAKDWEDKYNADTKSLNEKMQAQAYSFAVRDAANSLKFSSNAAKKQFIADATAKKLVLEGDKLLGFDDYVKSYRESDPDAFAVEKKPEPTEPEKKPQFSDQKKQTSQPGKQKLSLSEMMARANDGQSIDSLF